MAEKRQNITTVGFISLGCPKNTVDSEKMLALLSQAGFLITAEPEAADVVVINTCCFIEPAKAESLDAIKQATACKSRGIVRKVIVAGCLSERFGWQVFDLIEGIDAIVSLGQRDNIAQIVGEVLASDKPLLYLDPPVSPISDDRTRLLIGPTHRAYLRISEGCNHRCSFCTIPAIRGRFRSKPLQMVLDEAAELACAGVVELSVIAQDTTYYGRDLKRTDGLVTLLKELEEIDRLAWIRLMYLYPAGINDGLIEIIAKSSKIVHYLDIPIQHVSGRILKAMRRPDTRDSIWRLIDRLRSALPDVVLRTTLIVGFPGETEKEFTELVNFVEWAQFDALGCFKFYPESGTDAADLPDQVPEQIKEQKLEQVMLTQQEIAFAKNRNRRGTSLTCLIDSVDSKAAGQSRYYGQAPEVDSICIVKNCSAAPGEFVNAKVVGTKNYDLIVEQI